MLSSLYDTIFSQILTPRKKHILWYMDSMFCVKKATFEISQNILNPYTNKYVFYWLLFLCVIYDILELWRHKWDGPPT